jgi:DMSO/TMAO reductase YedYZ heme-binding membrane subunit
MIGILLFPFLILLAFTSGDVYSIGLNLSWYLVAGLLVYRIILTFGAVHNQVKVNPFHFFLYICAFEIVPLLLIYKGLLLLFRITA